MRDHGRAVLAANVEHQPAAGDADMQRERPLSIGTVRREQVLFDQIVDRDRALMLDVGPGTADRVLVERDRDDAIGRVVLFGRLGHDRLRRNPIERE